MEVFYLGKSCLLTKKNSENFNYDNLKVEIKKILLFTKPHHFWSGNGQDLMYKWSWCKLGEFMNLPTKLDVQRPN